MFLSTDPNTASSQRVLHTQHTLNQADWFEIGAIATAENIFEDVESFDLEKFFGFTCHLFVTTRSAQSRERLAAMLPKFGSLGVLPLLKIVYHFEGSTLGSVRNGSTPTESSNSNQKSLAELSLSALKAMPLQTLVYGLADAIDMGASDALTMKAIITPLLHLVAHYPKTLLSALCKELDTDSWNIMSAHLIGALSDIKNRQMLQNAVQTEHSHVDVAC